MLLHCIWGKAGIRRAGVRPSMSVSRSRRRLLALVAPFVIVSPASAQEAVTLDQLSVEGEGGVVVAPLVCELGNCFWRTRLETRKGIKQLSSQQGVFSLHGHLIFNLFG